MCNACGFLCCAYDGFSGCGCDQCPCPECWDPEDNDFTCDSDDDWGEFADEAHGDGPLTQETDQ